MELKDLIDIQLKERYKHFLIHGPSLCGKTELALKIAEQYQCKYISLLDYLIQDNEVKNSIDLFGHSKLIEFIQHIVNDERMVIIDQLDFLINTWSDSEVRELMAFVDKNQSECCYIFVMQTHKLLEKEDLISLSDKGTQRKFRACNLGGDING